MKWFVMVLAVLLVPVSAQALEHWKAKDMPGASVMIISDKYGTPRRATAIRFFIEPRDDGDDIRAKMRLFIPKDRPDDVIRKGRCELWVNNTLMDELGDHWVMGDHGRELWLPNLRTKDRVVLVVFWDQVQVVEYATM